MPRFALTLTPVPDRYGRPVDTRLRLALKRLLRDCALRCVEVREVKPKAMRKTAGEMMEERTNPSDLGVGVA